MIIPVLQVLSLADDSKSLVLKDATGTYDGTDNTGGYGTPNPDAPTIVGLTARWWSDKKRYANKVFNDGGGIITGLLSDDGYSFDTESLGLPEGAFPTGVHVFKYYPFEETDTIVSVTKNSKTVTRTAGTAPNSYSSSYKAIILLDSGDVISKVLILDKSVAATATTFTLDEVWDGETGSGYTMMIATEADLKILFTQLAIACLIGKIGALATQADCESRNVAEYMEWLAWSYAAAIKFSCADYTGAHQTILALDSACRKCKTSSPCACQH